MEKLTYRLEVYEGPLDLLLDLIAKNKIDIMNIPIALICDQYMQYITEAQAMDMELAGEFIVMASELLYIKSKMLLPRAEPDEEDPRASLAEALLLYKQAKEAAEQLLKSRQRTKRPRGCLPHFCKGRSACLPSACAKLRRRMRGIFRRLSRKRWSLSPKRSARSWCT